MIRMAKISFYIYVGQAVAGAAIGFALPILNLLINR
jgi:hypothetical protein